MGSLFYKGKDLTKYYDSEFPVKLSTKRQNKECPEGHFLIDVAETYMIEMKRKLFIYVTPEELTLFEQENHLKSHNITEMLSKLEIKCDKNKAGTILHVPDTTDPRKLPEDALKSLCNFHLKGLKGWGVVSNVIDGDTIDLCIYVPLQEINVGREILSRGKTKAIQSVAHTSHQNAGYFAKYRCRLFGVDTMEHNTKEGEFASKMMEEYYFSLNNHVYYELLSNDKYGRLLVNLYTKEDMQIKINNYLFKFNTKNFVVIESYDGGSKSEHAKNLVRKQNYLAAPPN